MADNKGGGDPRRPQPASIRRRTAPRRLRRRSMLRLIARPLNIYAALETQASFNALTWSVPLLPPPAYSFPIS
jgi:hypothetical protein